MLVTRCLYAARQQIHQYISLNNLKHNETTNKNGLCLASQGKSNTSLHTSAILNTEIACNTRKGRQGCLQKEVFYGNLLNDIVYKTVRELRWWKILYSAITNLK